MRAVREPPLRGEARKGVRGQVLDSSRSLGMIRLWRTGSPRGVGSGNRDGLEGRGPPRLDPSMLQRRTFSMLRVSGPSAPGKATGRSPLRDGEGIEPPPLRPRFLAEPRNDSEKGVGV